MKKSEPQRYVLMQNRGNFPHSAIESSAREKPDALAGMVRNTSPNSNGNSMRHDPGREVLRLLWVGDACVVDSLQSDILLLDYTSDFYREIGCKVTLFSGVKQEARQGMVA